MHTSDNKSLGELKLHRNGNKAKGPQYEKLQRIDGFQVWGIKDPDIKA